MTKLKNTLNLTLDLPSDLINIVINYTQSAEFIKIAEFDHHNDQLIKQGHINIDAINDTAKLEKSHILHKTLLTDIGTHIYIHWHSIIGTLQMHKISNYKCTSHKEDFYLSSYSSNTIIKDICLTSLCICFLLIKNNKPVLHLQSKIMQNYANLDFGHHHNDIALKFTPDHLFVIPNQPQKILALIKEETAFDLAELLLFSMTDFKFIETSSSIIKSHITYVLDLDTNIETDFYFSTNNNTTTYLGSKTYLTTKTEKFNAIYILNSSKRHLCVLRETHLELYEEYLSYD